MAIHFSILVWRIPWTVQYSTDYTVHTVTKSQTRLSGFHFHVIQQQITNTPLNYCDLGERCSMTRKSGTEQEYIPLISSLGILSSFSEITQYTLTLKWYHHTLKALISLQELLEAQVGLCWVKWVGGQYGIISSDDGVILSLLIFCLPFPLTPPLHFIYSLIFPKILGGCPMTIPANSGQVISSSYSNTTLKRFP